MGSTSWSAGAIRYIHSVTIVHYSTFVLLTRSVTQLRIQLKLKHDAIAIAGEVCHEILMYMRQMLHVAFHTTHSVCCRLTLTVLTVSQLTPAVFNASAVTYSGVFC
jgi:hypothetical protein